MKVYPLKMAPLYKEKIWGGRRLEQIYGKILPEGVKIGESWELADLTEGESVVSNGPMAGIGLGQVVGSWAKALTGDVKLTHDGRFPLLLKLLDADDDLSVQVHPDEKAVAEIPGSALKTECWYVLASDNGYIYRGLKQGVTADQFRNALDNDTEIADLMVRHDVKPGDFYYLPAGTVHALGAGVLVAEVQTPSDTTYRVSDWGRGREIHIERAMQCIHFEFSPLDCPGSGGDCLLKTDYFEVYLRTYAAGNTDIATGNPIACMILSGQGKILSDSDDPCVEFVAGDTIILPAALENCRLEAPVNTTMMETLLP